MDAPEPHPAYAIFPDPGDPDWTVYEPRGEGQFNALFGPIRVRAEGPARARCRVEAADRQRNINGDVHGGFALAFIDQTIFLGPQRLGITGSLNAVTIDISTQFFGPLRPGAPIDSVVDVLRETGRMIFVRGLLEQDGRPAVAFSATIRKAGGK